MILLGFEVRIVFWNLILFKSKTSLSTKLWVFLSDVYIKSTKLIKKFIIILWYYNQSFQFIIFIGADYICLTTLRKSLPQLLRSMMIMVSRKLKWPTTLIPSRRPAAHSFGANMRIWSLCDWRRTMVNCPIRPGPICCFTMLCTGWSLRCCMRVSSEWTSRLLSIPTRLLATWFWLR